MSNFLRYQFTSLVMHLEFRIKLSHGYLHTACRSFMQSSMMFKLRYHAFDVYILSILNLSAETKDSIVPCKRII